MKILMITPNMADATSYYRAWGIAPDLSRRTKWQIDCFDWGDKVVNWSTLAPYDVIMMQRPGDISAVRVAEYCKKMNKPLWIDFDDDYFNLPYSHYAVQHYNQMRPNLQALLQMSDLLTVSTKSIAQTMSQFASNVVVVPNAVQDYLMELPGHPETKVMLWRGGKQHDPDIFAYSGAIQSAINMGVKTKFIGLNPYYLTNYTTVETLDIYEYFHWLNALNPRCVFVPLIDNKWNHSISNIAWIEATMAGSVCLAPGWEEWSLPGVINYKPENFLSLMVQIWSDEFTDQRRHYHELSREYILEHLVLSQTNKVRQLHVGML